MLRNAGGIGFAQLLTMTMPNNFDAFLRRRAASLIHRLAVATGAEVEVCADVVPLLLEVSVLNPAERWAETKHLVKTHDLPAVPVLALLNDIAREFTVFVHEMNLPVVVGSHVPGDFELGDFAA